MTTESKSPAPKTPGSKPPEPFLDRLERWVQGIVAYLDGKKTNWLGWFVIGFCGLWLICNPPPFLERLFFGSVASQPPAFTATGEPLTREESGGATTPVIVRLATLAGQVMAARAATRKEGERTRAALANLSTPVRVSDPDTPPPPPPPYLPPQRSPKPPRRRPSDASHDEGWR